MSMNASDTPSPDEALLRNLLERVAAGEVTVDEAVPQVQLLSRHASHASGAAAVQAFTTFLQPTIQRQTAAAAWIVGGIFAFIGTIFFCVGVGVSYRTFQFLDAPQAEGVIVGGGRNPTAKYEVDGKEYRVSTRISSSPPAFNVGDKVTVLYRPDNPADAQIDGFVERWLFLLIFGGLGAVFGLIGWGMLFFKILGRLFRAQPLNIDESQRFTVE